MKPAKSLVHGRLSRCLIAILGALAFVLVPVWLAVVRNRPPAPKVFWDVVVTPGIKLAQSFGGGMHDPWAVVVALVTDIFLYAAVFYVILSALRGRPHAQTRSH